jgi:F-box/TPR repeat protein Pof3
LGQVLRLDGSPEKALAIYEYALQKLPEDNRSRDVSLLPMQVKLHISESCLLCFCTNITSSFPANCAQTLSQLLKKVQDQLAGGNRRDPFTVLPLELAEWTLKSFSFQEVV